MYYNYEIYVLLALNTKLTKVNPRRGESAETSYSVQLIRSPLYLMTVFYSSIILLHFDVLYKHLLDMCSFGETKTPGQKAVKIGKNNTGVE